MYTEIMNIYEKLNFKTNKAINTCPSYNEAINYLSLQLRLFPHNEIYSNLLIEIVRLKLKFLPAPFIERYCISVLAKRIIDIYDINIAEAYAISYVILNKRVSRLLTSWKTSTSGLFEFGSIDGSWSLDKEAIAGEIIKNLNEKKLLKIMKDDTLIPGINFKLNLP